MQQSNKIIFEERDSKLNYKNYGADPGWGQIFITLNA
jgi:hypothetical protein